MGDSSNSSNGSEAPYLAIARRKSKLREEALHTPSSISIRVPSDLLPTNSSETGKSSAQNVSHVPAKLLNNLELEITSLSVPALLSRIRSGRYTSSTVAAAFIRRASITHQLTNCLTEPLFTRALTRAADLDKFTAQNNGATVGPLHGLPVSVKDTFNVAGYDSSIGLASLCFSPAKNNAPLVDLLESLGAIVIAKTNVPQTMASLDSVNNVFGRTMNPFNRRLTAGGSSGGEGVLVAMGGSAIGFGTDVGGSIRIPAMCNGIYGLKPSVGRVPFGGQQGGGQDGMGRVGIQAVAGPIARNMEDINFVMQAIMPEAWKFGEDCTSMLRSWPANNQSSPLGHRRIRNRPYHGSGSGSGPHGEFTIGILRSDNNCQLLPPISKIIDETAHILRQNSEHLHLRIIDLPTPSAWQKSQTLMSKLMGLDGGATMSKFILDTAEPLVPWMQSRFKHNGKPQPLTRAAELQATRAQLESEMLTDLWGVYTDSRGRRHRTVDAVICPVAPHPVPEIERYNAVGYTSSWVLFDYPAGVVPVRDLREEDLELGVAMDKQKELGSWDERNRELWDEAKTDRRVYLGSKLSVQCVTGRGEDEKLLWVMGVLDGCVRRERRKNDKKGGVKM